MVVVAVNSPLAYSAVEARRKYHLTRLKHVGRRHYGRYGGAVRGHIVSDRLHCALMRNYFLLVLLEHVLAAREEAILPRVLLHEAVGVARRLIHAEG